MFSQRLSVCPSVALEVQIPSNIAVALNLFFSCDPGLPSQGSSARRKTCHAPNTATFQRGSSIRTHRLPPNRANGVTLFEGSPIRYNNT